jgi:hypothetical protein
MNQDLQDVYAEVDRELSPQWLKTSKLVRELSTNLETEATGTPLAASAQELAANVGKLCDHLERLHSDVEQLLGRFDDPEIPVEYRYDGDSAEIPEEEVQKENIQIQREMHQQSDLQHIIKALFMWKDDPTDRVREKK